MPDWLVEALEGLLEWVQGVFDSVRDGLITYLAEMDWIHLSSVSWSTGKPLAGEFLTLAYVGYGLVIVVGGFIVMAHESVQTRYSVREIAPRLVASLLLAGLSLVLVEEAMEVNNGIVDGFSVIAIEMSASGVDYLEDFPSKLDPESWENAEWDYLDCVDESGEAACEDEKPNRMVDILWIVLTVVCLLVLIFTAFVRNIAFFFVVVCAPVALACHGLPVTEWAARLWWRMLGACMASSIGQAALVWVYVKMTDTYFWGYLFHIQVVDLYLLVIVWMMWKVHQQAFHIARGRPLQIPGSRLAQALVMSKAMDMMSGRSRKRSNRSRDGNGRRRQPQPHTDADRFPDLPPEPEGFGAWADSQRQLEAHRAANPRPNHQIPDAPSSPLADAIVTDTESKPDSDRARPSNRDGRGRTGDGGGPVQRPNPRLAPAASPLDEAAPEPSAEPDDQGPRSAAGSAAGAAVGAESQPLANLPDGALLPPRDPEPPVVRVRTDEVVPLAERRTEATQANARRDAEEQAEAAKAEAEARAKAAQQQAELRRRASAAMARMAASPDSKSHEIPAAGPAHHAPPPKPGVAPGSGPALGSVKRPAGGER